MLLSGLGAACSSRGARAGCCATMLLAGTVGFTLPVLRTPRPYYPLDCASLTLKRSTFESLGADEHRKWLGLLYCHPQDPTRAHLPPEHGAVGQCGVICEVSECGVMTESDRVLVRGVAFARFRTKEPFEGVGSLRLSSCEVEPVSDLPPEEDELLRESHGLESRGEALEASERRCHLLFRQVEQMLQWSGDDVAVSARAAALGAEEHAETHRAVHRFAPVRAERVAWAADEVTPTGGLEPKAVRPAAERLCC